MAIQPPLARLPRELRPEIFALALKPGLKFSKPRSKAARKRSRRTLGLLFSCKAFSAEAIDILYKRHTFALDGQELDIVLAQCPHVCLVKSVELVNITPIDLHDQSRLEDFFAPIDRLVSHCKKLKRVFAPYENGRGLRDDNGGLILKAQMPGFG